MTKSQYARYLQSDHWRALRKETVEAVPECERCDLPRWLCEMVYDQDLHVHHLSYANLGAEPPEDLEVLCPRCHEVETFGRSELREIKPQHCELCQARHWDKRANLCGACFAVFETPYLYQVSSAMRPDREEDAESYILRALLFNPCIENVETRVKTFTRIISEEFQRLLALSADEIVF